MKIATQATLPIAFMLMLTLPACTESGSGNSDHAHGDDTHVHQETSKPKAASADSHVHADGSTHANHAEDTQQGHMEIPLEPVSIDGMDLILTQNHGPVNAGEEEHLIIRITENGDEIEAVRAWIGGEDRSMSYVGKGEYSLLSDAYDIHTIAPDPLPENAMWWIELEKRDGTKVVVSTKPAI